MDGAVDVPAGNSNQSPDVPAGRLHVVGGPFDGLRDQLVDGRGRFIPAARGVCGDRKLAPEPDDVADESESLCHREGLAVEPLGGREIAKVHGERGEIAKAVPRLG